MEITIENLTRFDKILKRGTLIELERNMHLEQSKWILYPKPGNLNYFFKTNSNRCSSNN